MCECMVYVLGSSSLFFALLAALRKLVQVGRKRITLGHGFLNGRRLGVGALSHCVDLLKFSFFFVGHLRLHFVDLLVAQGEILVEVLILNRLLFVRCLVAHLLLVGLHYSLAATEVSACSHR